MAAKAQEISMEAGSKMAAAMKDVINAAAGISGFAMQSARDLVQYMVRRGQMTQDEADKLIREVEEAQAKRGVRAAPPTGTSAAKQPAAKQPAAKQPAAKPAPKSPAAKQPAPKPAAKTAAKAEPGRKAPVAAKKAAAKPAPAKKPAPKTKRR
jgi:polyhydroxyalkanoate synthesis regulator phasin